MDQEVIDKYMQQEQARQMKVFIDYNIFNYNMYNIILLLYDLNLNDGSWMKRWIAQQAMQLIEE